MMYTHNSRDHLLWSQITAKEQQAKSRFEFLTGATQADRFYNGQNQRNVDQHMLTHSKLMSQDRVKTLMSGNMRGQEAGSAQRSQKEKSEILSRALGEIMAQRKHMQ